jgi:hypothetical protein
MFNASVGLLGISWMLPIWVVVTRILHGICIWRIMALLDISSCHGNHPGTPVSSTTNTERHDITEILLKVALNTIRPIEC